MVNACCSLPFVGKTLYILLLYVHARGKNILQRSSFRESMKLGCKVTVASFICTRCSVGMVSQSSHLSGCILSHNLVLMATTPCEAT